MRIKLARILEELREDHRNLAQLLDLLEAECKDLPNDGEPDFELLRDIMQYTHTVRFVVDPRSVVNPGDVAVSLMGADAAKRASPYSSDIEAIISGAAVTRQHLLDDLVNYVGHLRRHIEWEEADLFPRADSLARDNETATVDVSMYMDDDPVFGATTAKSFSNLLANLQRLG